MKGNSQGVFACPVVLHRTVQLTAAFPGQQWATNPIEPTQSLKPGHRKKRSMRRSAHRIVPNPSSIWLARTIEHDHSTISGAIPNKHPAVFLGPVSKGGTCLEIDFSLEDLCPCLYDAEGTEGMQFYNEIFSHSLYRIKDLQVIPIIYRVYS